MSSLMVQLQSSWLLCPPSGPISWTPSQASENVRILFDQALRIHYRLLPGQNTRNCLWHPAEAWHETVRSVKNSGDLAPGEEPSRGCPLRAQSGLYDAKQAFDFAAGCVSAS